MTTSMATTMNRRRIIGINTLGARIIRLVAFVPVHVPAARLVTVSLPRLHFIVIYITKFVIILDLDRDRIKTNVGLVLGIAPLTRTSHSS